MDDLLTKAIDLYHLSIKRKKEGGPSHNYEGQRYPMINRVNSFFTKQCSSIYNSSEFPSFLLPKTDKSLSNITLTEKDIEKAIQNLDANKAHGHDMICVGMLKICGKSIIKPLLMIYKKCYEKGCFPDEWK